MIIIKFKLRDFPADVQDLLRDRAVERCVPIADVIRDFVMETSDLIVRSAHGEDYGEEG